MIKQLKATLYILKRDPKPFAALAIHLILTFYILFDARISILGAKSLTAVIEFFKSFTCYVLMTLPLSSVIFVNLTIGRDIADGARKNKIAIGISRGSIFATDFVTIGIFNLVCFAIHALVLALIFKITAPWFEFTWARIKNILPFCLMWITAWTAFITMIMTVFDNEIARISTGMIFVIANIFMEEAFPFSYQIMKMKGIKKTLFLFLSKRIPFRFQLTSLSGVDVQTAAQATLTITILCLVMGYLAIKRKDIK